MIAKDSSLCKFQIEANSRVYVFGGETFPEELFIEWNFVATNKDLIEKAREDWRNNGFPGFLTKPISPFVGTTIKKKIISKINS